MPDITVSIVSYNTRELLRACLKSLLARHDEGEATLEILVADNGSSDGSMEMIEKKFPRVQLLHSGGNIGYGRANNLALEQARGRYFLVLNSDTEVEPGALAAMRDFLDDHADVGVAGARLILPDGSTQASCARDPNLLDFFWEQTYLHKIFPGSAIMNGYTLGYWAYEERREVEQICGACLLIRREAFRQVDGFDPAYFMYFEDTDLCLRLRRAGWRLMFLPEARIRHHIGGSSSADWRTRARMIAAYNQSRYSYFHRHHGARRARLLKAIVVLGAALRLIGWSLRVLDPRARTDARHSVREKVRLFRDVLRRTCKMTA